MCNLVFLFCSLRCSSVYLVFYCNMFGEVLSACLPTALNASSGWSCVSYAWEFWAMILLKVFSVPLPYLSSYSFPTEISKFSFTSEIVRVLASLSYCFFFFLVCFSSLVFRSWCSAFRFLYLISVQRFFFFITRISIWLFYISLYWIHHSFSCVVFNISLSSLLLSPFKSLKTLCLFGFWNILLILPFHSLSGTLSTFTLWNHYCGVVGFWFS